MAASAAALSTSTQPPDDGHGGCSALTFGSPFRNESNLPLAPAQPPAAPIAKAITTNTLDLQHMRELLRRKWKTLGPGDSNKGRDGQSLIAQCGCRSPHRSS